MPSLTVMWWCVTYSSLTQAKIVYQQHLDTLQTDKINSFLTIWQFLFYFYFIKAWWWKLPWWGSFKQGAKPYWVVVVWWLFFKINWCFCLRQTTFFRLWDSNQQMIFWAHVHVPTIFKRIGSIFKIQRTTNNLSCHPLIHFGKTVPLIVFSPS